jgi:hypothetical protein
VRRVERVRLLRERVRLLARLVQCLALLPLDAGVERVDPVRERQDRGRERARLPRHARERRGVGCGPGGAIERPLPAHRGELARQLVECPGERVVHRRVRAGARERRRRQEPGERVQPAERPAPRDHHRRAAHEPAIARHQQPPLERRDRRGDGLPQLRAMRRRCGGVAGEQLAPVRGHLGGDGRARAQRARRPATAGPRRARSPRRRRPARARSRCRARPRGDGDRGRPTPPRRCRRR